MTKASQITDTNIQDNPNNISNQIEDYFWESIQITEAYYLDRFS